MKNDFVADGRKISVPPTVLYSMVAAIEDVRRVVTTEFKRPGDLIFQVGSTYDELGGSAFYKLFGSVGANVPRLRSEQSLPRYRAMSRATAAGLVASCHDLSDGGLAVATAECCIGGGLGALIDASAAVSGMADAAAGGRRAQAVALFSESHSRFVVGVAPRHRTAFEEVLGEDATLIGEVTATARLGFAWGGETILDVSIGDLLAAWQGGLGL